MAQLITMKLSRFDGSPWGFRLQGGKDFGTPLVVQKVNNGSPAEAAGLRAGDAVVRVNSTEVFSLRHKDAQDVIVRAGNNFEVTVQRGGGSTWRPSVSPVTTSIPSPQPTAPIGNVSPVTKTSLAAKKQDVHLIGSGHNFSPKPFLNGTSDGTVKSIVNKQYNSPVGIYSEETIAETLSAQAEVLAGGVVGVNFKKNEKNYNAQNSEVFKMVQEADKEPKTPEPAEPVVQSGVASPVSPALAGLRSVQAPETKPPSSTPPASLQPGQNICAECERLIVGVFVRIKEKNLHVECFKCSTCGTSLKNVGYYNINNKLYCDIHAKMVARQASAPAGMVPVTVGPGQKAPANTISAALSNINIGSPTPSLSNHGSSSPQPFSQSYCARAYSPETSITPRPYRNGYTNGSSNGGSPIGSNYYNNENISNNGYEPATYSNGGDSYAESAKTYTSTITIQTCNNQQQQNGHKQEQQLDYNRNPTNEHFNNIDNKLHKLTDDIRDFAFDNNGQQLQRQSFLNDERDYCARTVYSPTAVRAFKPIRLGSSPFSQPAYRPVQAPTSNLGGPKPFIGSSITNQNYTSPASPVINTGSSTLPRPQNQSVTETTSYHAELCDRRQTGPRPQSYHEECCSYEVVQEICRPKTTEKPPTPKKTWPPVKAIEDITYPTASPLYIDPNPVIDKRSRQVTRERRAAIESVISREHSRRSSLCEPQYYHQHDSEMDKLSCPGPVYRRVELVNAKESRQQRCERSTSRASSADSVRRSLTPTRITQPIPRPWTATVSSGTNVYESSYTSEQENICSSYCGKQECQQEKVCRREQSCEREPPAPPGHRHREQHLHKEEDTCKNEGSVHRHEHKTSNVCKFVCEATPEPEPQPEPQVEQEERVDFSKLVPPDVAICPKGIDAEHDLYTETEEEDKGNMHIKKTTTYEKTVELVSPDREMGPPFGKQDQQTEVVREEYTQRSSTVDREVESISGRRHITETSESLTQKIDTQQMLEEARKQEEEDRKRREQEERRQREEDERKRQEEERLIAEMRRREEEQRRQKEEAERKRKEEERRRIEQEERERSSSQVCRSERTETYEEEIHSGPRERIIDIQIEDAPCKCASAQVVERPPSRERIIKVEREEDKPCKTQVREVQEEVNIKQHCEHRDYEEQRKRSLREQVEVHQNLREQQAPKRQPSLQERRICSRLSQQSEGQQQQSTCTKKHVQFVKQTESGTCPLPQTPIKNATPKEWKSEMCKALTTASEQPYAPLGINRPSSAQETYSREVTYEQKTVCARCEAENRPVSPFVQALTTASDRPYSPLGRDVNPQGAVCRCQRSQTPDIKSTYEGYSQPSEILYRNPPKDPPRRPDGPRPLPTPPPDFRFRNRSVSPNYRSETRSRSATPSGRLSACGLKRPDTIPSYQKYLICEEQAPVQSQDFPCSRTSTPACTKSPAPGPPEPPACYLRAQAPRIRDETPPCKRAQRDTTTPDKTETVRRHFEEDTPQGHKTTDTISSKTVHWVGQGSAKHAHVEEHDDVITEECDGSHHVKKVEHKLKEYDDPEPPAESPVDSDRCYISQNSDTEPTLPCPTQSTVLERIQRTGVRVFAPTGQPEVRRIVHEIPPPEPEPPCPMTGVQVLPIRAHGDQSCKTGVVVVPCDGIGSRGVCITPTPDRSGVRVSPCPAESGGICKKPSCYCGSTSGKCTNLGNVSTTTTLNSRAKTSSSTCSSSGICIKSTGNGGCSISPCPGIPGVRSVQCPKTPPKCLGAAKANLPFPNIPLPEEDVEEQPPCVTCPLASSCVKSTSTSFSTTSESRDCGFQPIHKPQPPQQPRTNLCNQITTLTLCKRETKSPVMPPVPTVQLYKPQPAPPAPPCRSSSQQNRFRRETTQTTTTSCQSQNSRTETQTRCLSSKTQSSVDPPNLSSHPDLGAGGFGGGNKGGSRAGSSAPNRGRGILNQAGSGCRVPLCAACNNQVRGPFISALGQIWCPEHFVCVNPQCRRGLQDIGFVEEKGQLYCEYCFERFIAPSCDKCNNKIKGDCLNAIGKHFHPECFNCAHCGKLFGNSPFFLEEGLPYCERDWNDLFTTKCFACGFPVEAGDRWVEALNNNYHSQCFNCTMCKKNLEGQSFYAKGGRPFCKNHAR